MYKVSEQIASLFIHQNPQQNFKFHSQALKNCFYFTSLNIRSVLFTLI